MMWLFLVDILASQVYEYMLSPDVIGSICHFASCLVCICFNSDVGSKMAEEKGIYNPESPPSET